MAEAHEWEFPEYEPELPVSEKSNPLTRDIDRASANHVVRLLEACDAEMFQEDSRSTYQKLFSDGVVTTMMEVAKRVAVILKEATEGMVVMSGCGTSGRLAFAMAKHFNRLLKELNQSPVFAYIIAGEDRALLSSQEASEDDPKLGMLSLRKLSKGKRRVLFIGISCGLSAPFVAGQLHLCLQHPDIYIPVLVGFNPASQARNEPLLGHTFTFHSVVRKLEELAASQKAFLLNPTVGPEAITGSSRMKGGSATKILLESVLSAAHTAVYANQPITFKGISQRLRAYQTTVNLTYAHSEAIAVLVEAAGQSLRCGGRVCYLGWGCLGAVGLIDASECIPTFGADYEDVRGFISGGYQSLGNREGPLTTLGPQFAIAHEDFLRLILPNLSDQDTVLLIYTHYDDAKEVEKVAQRVREGTPRVHALYHGSEELSTATSHDKISELCSSVLNIPWPSSVLDSTLCMRELSTKLVLNAVSTGAHVLKGKVYRNHMIDLQVTNSKLYHRATRLLQALSGSSETQCKEALLRAIYHTDHLTTDIVNSDITTHTLAASARNKVIPLALVSLLIGCSLTEAESHLACQPVVRDAVEACLTSST